MGLFLMLAGGLPFNVCGQRLKYEDLHADLENMTNEQAYYRFFNYQKSNPHFANTYIQLGHISETFYSRLDPLRQIESVKHWTYNARIYYQLFSIKLENNEVRRTRSFFSNIPIEASGRRLSNEDVLEYALERMQKARHYEDTVILVYEALEKAKDHYNHCIRIFSRINEQYDNIKETLLQTDADFLKQLDILEFEFKACTLAFDHYKKLLHQFPLGDYNQAYVLKPIETFRLDGIINSDFLRDTFYLWDYGSWVSQFRQKYDEDILSLRQEVEDIQRIFDFNLRMLERKDFAGQQLLMDAFNEFFVYRLGVYDNNSLIRELFNYLDTRQSFLTMGKDSLNNPVDSSSALMSRKIRYYFRLSSLLDQSRQRLETFASYINPEQYRRFKDFFDRYYGGQGGLLNFHSQQHSMLNSTFSAGLENLFTYFSNEDRSRKQWPPALGQEGLQVSLHPVSAGDTMSDKGSHITKDVSFLSYQPAYVSGYTEKNGQAEAFISRITEGNKIDWIRSAGKDFIAEKAFAYEKGVLTLVSSLHANLSTPDSTLTDNPNNRLVHFDLSGSPVFNAEIDVQGMPLSIHYDDINKLSRMVFGNPSENMAEVYKDLVLCQADSSGQVMWKTPLGLNGTLAGFALSENSLLLFVNEGTFTGINQEHPKASVASPKSYVVFVSYDGTILDTMPLDANGDLTISHAFNISSDEINIIGTLNPITGQRKEYFYKVLSATDRITVFSFPE